MTASSAERLKQEMQDRAILFRALIDRFGPGVLSIAAQHTAAQAEARLAVASLDRRDLVAVMTLLWDHAAPGTEFEVATRRPDYLALRVTRCPFADEMRRLRASDIGDALYCAYDHGFCRGLNPDIEFTRTHTLMAGDTHCDHTYRLPRG